MKKKNNLNPIRIYSFGLNDMSFKFKTKTMLDTFRQISTKIPVLIFLLLISGCNNSDPTVNKEFDNALKKITGSAVANETILKDYPNLIRSRNTNQFKSIALSSRSPKKTATAIQILGMIGGSSGRSALKTIVSESKPPYSWYAAAQVGKVSSAQNKNDLEKIAAKSKTYNRIIAALTPLRWLGDQQTIDKLTELKKVHSDPKMIRYYEETIAAINYRLTVLKDQADKEKWINMEIQFWTILLYPRMSRSITADQLSAARDISAKGPLTLGFLDRLLSEKLHDAQVVAALLLGLQNEVSRILQLQYLETKGETRQLKKMAAMALEMIQSSNKDRKSQKDKRQR